MKTRIRKKGGGRKPFDNKYSKRQFIRRLNAYFEYNYSVKGFVSMNGISRQSFYRFLNNNPELKEKVFSTKEANKQRVIRNRKERLEWMFHNPTKDYVDYLLRNSFKQ